MVSYVHDRKTGGDSVSYPHVFTYFSQIFREPIHLIIDVTLLTILALFMIHGARKGIVSTIFSFVKPIGSLLIACLFCRVFGALLFEIGIFDNMINNVKESIIEIVTEDEFLAQNQGKTVTGFTGIIGALFSLSGNNELATKISGIMTCDEAIITDIARSVVSAFSVIVAFVVLLFLGRLIMILLCKLINRLCKLPGLHAMNTVAGLLYGFLVGGFVVWLSSYFIYFLCSWLGTTVNIPFFAAFGNGEKTYVQQFFFHFNPIQFALKSLADSMVFA